jgi:hypothetical protein
MAAYITGDAADAQAQGGQCSYYKIALLFLTTGDMPHENLWRRWLEQAAGLIPLEVLQRPSCSKERLKHLKARCQPRPGTDAVDAQYLFTIYVHPPPDHPGASRLP